MWYLAQQTGTLSPRRFGLRPERMFVSGFIVLSFLFVLLSVSFVFVLVAIE